MNNAPRKCPIHMDEFPELCSAGTCDACVKRRIAALEAALATARNDALEEAARKAESMSFPMHDTAAASIGMRTAGRETAAAIRALKNPQSP